MKKVYKYPLQPTDKQMIPLPKDAKIIHLDVQRGIPCIWALVDPDLPLEPIMIYTYGTGHEINEEGLLYIGSYQLLGGDIVFHAFREYTFKAVPR
jgi:hypothetical protein